MHQYSPMNSLVGNDPHPLLQERGMFTKTSARFALLAIVFGGVLGCGAEDRVASRMQSSSETYAPREDAGGTSADEGQMPATAATDGPPAATQTRRIIYNTAIALVVDNYQDFEKQIVVLVNDHGGFISHSETSRQFSDRQSGTWTVRVPVDQHTEFLTSVTSLGFAESRRENAQDVTEEFFDIEARIKNKRELEKRIITMLEERTGKLSDVLEIERELSRIREEIERMEGRLRYLSDRTSLATITINCREEQQYTPAEAPTFASRISRSWRGSLGALTTTGENLLVAFVAVVPWLVVLAIPVALALAGYRLSRRR